MKKLYIKFKLWMNYNPPGVLSFNGWSLFEKEFKERAPIRYWISNVARLRYYLPIVRKWDKICDWFAYRTIRRYHVVKTGLPPGYQEFDNKMLHTNFNMLVDFVEVDQAWHNYAYSADNMENRTWSQKHLPFFGWFFRQPELGVKYLEWASTLDDPSLPPQERCDHQAVTARETLFLYNWWKNIRPNRRDIEIPKLVDDSGNDDFLEIFEDLDHNSDSYKTYQAALNQTEDLENKRKLEDDEMLIRLVKIRHELWI